MASDGADEARLAGVFAAMRPVLNERQWRRLLGAEARARGHGGIASVARASGAAESAVTAGARELELEEAGGEPLPPGRSRRGGGGRKEEVRGQGRRIKAGTAGPGGCLHARGPGSRAPGSPAGSSSAMT
jgi:hypothetical protein